MSEESIKYTTISNPEHKTEKLTLYDIYTVALNLEGLNSILFDRLGNGKKYSNLEDIVTTLALLDSIKRKVIEVEELLKTLYEDATVK